MIELTNAIMGCVPIKKEWTLKVIKKRYPDCLKCSGTGTVKKKFLFITLEKECSCCFGRGDHEEYYMDYPFHPEKSNERYKTCKQPSQKN